MTIDDNELNDYDLALRIYINGLKVHPDKVTEILGIKPTSKRAIGEPGQIIGKKVGDAQKVINLVPSKHNIWGISTSKLIDKEDSEFIDHWNVLYDIIKGREDKFKKLKPIMNTVVLSLDIFAVRYVPGVEINPEVLNIISSFGFRLDLDILL